MIKISIQLRNAINKLTSRSNVFKTPSPLLDELIYLTSFLDESANWCQRVWHIKNNYYTKKLCIECNGDIKWKYKKGYGKRVFCSNVCANNSAITQAKIEKTCIDRFGVKNPSQSNIIKNKRMKTTKERFGVENAFQSDDIKRKVRETMKARYGVEHGLQSEIIQSKVRETMKARYGVEYPLQSKEIYNNMVNNLLVKYNVGHISNHPEIRERVKRKNLETIGVENPFASAEVQLKIKKSMLVNWGVEYPAQCKILQDKRKLTNLEKYNAEEVFNNPDVQNKIDITNMLKYNTLYPMQNMTIKNKGKQTHYDNHAGKYFSQSHLSDETLQLLEDRDFLYTEHKVNKKSLTEIAFDLKCSQTTISNRFDHHDISIQLHGGVLSTGEKQLHSYVASIYIGTILYNSRDIILPYELDMYIPSHNLAIEYCGIYWHNEIHKPTDYHRIKYDLCKEKGIRLITIFEDEWLENRSLIENKLKNILDLSQDEKIFARKCIIKQVPTQEKSIFFNKTHIQGDGPSSINLGLYYNDELVACLGFIKEKNNTYNLSRYSTAKNVVGGFTKLLSYFEKTYHPKQIYTFADLRWSEGDLYYKSGFVLDKTLEPDYSYVLKQKRIHKFNMRHKQLAKKLKIYDPALSEHQNCLNNGIYRIYDCGKLKFVKNY